MNHTRTTRRLDAEDAREAHLEELGVLLEAALLAVEDLRRDLEEVKEHDPLEWGHMVSFYLRSKSPEHLLERLKNFLEGWRNS